MFRGEAREKMKAEAASGQVSFQFKRFIFAQHSYEHFSVDCYCLRIFANSALNCNPSSVSPLR